MNIEIKRSSRKTLAIEVSREGEVMVRAPYQLPLSEIEKLVEKKSDWIRKQIEKMQERKSRESAVEKLTPEQVRELADRAKEVIPERAAYFAEKIGVAYGRITIRNQKTRWGSCSSKGNLNFNCLLMLAPPEVLDYVVVHELCHRKEMNHSDRFWHEVEKVLPDYRRWQKWLKDNGGGLIFSY